MNRVRFHASLLLLLWWIAGAAAWAREVPYLQGRVTDDAEILSADARARISGMLEALEGQTTDQVAVLTVPSLEGESVESFALRVFEDWKLGQRGQDNGVLVVVAPGERRMRIEVGYGLEGRLTDLEAGRIIRNVMAPRFKEGDFDGGIAEGVAAIIAQLQGEDSPASEPAAATPQKDSFFEGPDLGLIERILIGSFIFGIIGLFTAIGVLTPGAGWFLYFFLIPFWAMFPIVVVGTTGAFVLLLIYLIGFPVAKIILSRTAWYQRAGKQLKKKGRARIGGFTITSGGGGIAGWSSSGGGGGFSGGGGSSGGGGASGSW
jgi:uncharacterized protein